MVIVVGLTVRVMRIRVETMKSAVTSVMGVATGFGLIFFIHGIPSFFSVTLIRLLELRTVDLTAVEWIDLSGEFAGFDLVEGLGDHVDLGIHVIDIVEDLSL